MKDKPCCYDCLHHARVKGLSSCKLTNKELVNPFEMLCEKFECFQCSKRNIEKCECYKEMR